MPSDNWKVSVEGMVETREKMAQVSADLAGEPFVDAMQQAATLVLRDARVMAPVDTGRLKNSITADVIPADKSVQGVIGTNVSYAPYMEQGTKPHWPPLEALKVWAERHKIPVMAVALAIATKGLAARKFLEGALDKNQDKIKALLEDFVSRVVKK